MPAPAILNSKSFKSKIWITRRNPVNGNLKDDKIAPSLKYLSNLRTLEIFLSNCKFNLIVTWSEDFVIFSTTGETKFSAIDTKLYVPVVTLSTQDNIKLLKQLESGLEEISIKKVTRKTKSIFRLLKWSKFSGSKQTFCFIVWKSRW